MYGKALFYFCQPDPLSASAQEIRKCIFFKILTSANKRWHHTKLLISLDHDFVKTCRQRW